MSKIYDIIIVGAGPAGLTSAIYSVRGGRKVLVIGGIAPGGQLMLTTDVEDYPGFVQPVQGPELVRMMRDQGKRLGAEFLDEKVEKVNFKKQPFELETTSKQKFLAKAVIIAVGSDYKWLDLPSEFGLRGRGISTCAICDAPFHKGKDIVVVGGGDSALREAIFAANFCKSVTVIHRRDTLRAQAALQQKAKEKKNIKWIWNSEVVEFIGKNLLEAVKIKNIVNGKETVLEKISGAFIAIGHQPNTNFLKGQVELDQKGYVVVKNGTETSVPGVFAAGDVRDYRYQQAVTAAGFGCMAAMDADAFLHGFREISEKARKKAR